MDRVRTNFFFRVDYDSDVMNPGIKLCKIRYGLTSIFTTQHDFICMGLR